MIARTFLSAALAAVLGAATLVAPGPAVAGTKADCPNGGTVRFGVEPFESAAIQLPVYKALGKLIGEKLGCNVTVSIVTSYNAEIEAMRSGKLDIAQFGPLGYVLAHKVAGAEAVASFSKPDGSPATYTASIVTWPGSGIKTIQQVRGKSFAFSDPASTSGHLFPAYGLRINGIDPDHHVRGIFAGSHTASYEAIRHHKVEAGELNSNQIVRAKVAGEYNPADFVTLWTSKPIPDDAITVRNNLPAGFKDRAAKVLAHLDMRSLPAKDRKLITGQGPHLVPANDHTYDLIRSLVSTLHIDLAKL